MALQDEFAQERNLRVLARWRSTARVLVEEHKLYPAALALVAAGRAPPLP